MGTTTCAVALKSAGIDQEILNPLGSIEPGTTASCCGESGSCETLEVSVKSGDAEEKPKRLRARSEKT